MLDDTRVDANVAGYVADRNLYLDADGNVVEADDPAKQTLLVAKGGKITYAYARAMGLLPAEATEDTGGEKKFASLFPGAKGEAENAAMAEEDGTETKEVRRTAEEKPSSARVEDKEVKRAERK